MKKLIVLACWLLLVAEGVHAQGPKKLLLLAQGPDGHPPQTHEYELGLKTLHQLLEKAVPADLALAIKLVKADEPWREGPELLAGADGVVIFLSEGAKWSQHDPKRAKALAGLANRGGGIAVLHWGMGTKDAKNIDPFLQLAGACHGGPDRKYKVLATEIHLPKPDHPVTRGLKVFKVRDEFYYFLKMNKSMPVTPLFQADIDGNRETVAWALDRPGGGRSFGFSGLHFHENWSVPEYRRLVVQGVIWTMGGNIPLDGLKVP